MRKKGTKSTIREVAAYAGVSPTTVSHALSGKRPVSPRTHAAIRQAMELLGYEPSLIAQRLAGQPTQTIALLFPLVSGLFSSVDHRFIPAFGQPIAEQGYTFLVIYSPQMEMTQFRRFISSRLADGVLLMQLLLDDPRIPWLYEYEVPFVTIGRPQSANDIPFVDQDFEAGMRQTLEHLAQFGHHHVALFSYQDESIGFVARQRAAFINIATKLGITPVIAPTEFSDVSAYHAMRAMLETHSPVTAIIVWSDLNIIGIEQALAERNLRVPEDISLVCYDRTPAFSMLAEDLTIIDTDIETMGQKAARLLLQILAGEMPEPKQELIPSRLIIGRSTGPAR